MSFTSENPWIILSSIELAIKQKIESMGRPLKEWDINIYRGVLTGCNEAFIIDGKTRATILENCKTDEERTRTDEVIRPILRGRDIKKYGYDFADNFLVAFFPSRKYDIDDFPSLKQYLLHFSEQELRENGFNWIADNPETLMSYSKQKLEQSGEPIMIDGHTISFGKTQQKSRKLTSNKWFETQDSISYWDDFNRPKILWKRIGSILRFSYDNSGKMGLDSTCFATGHHLEYLCCVLNSRMGRYILQDAPKTGTGDLLISVQAVEPVHVPIVSDEINRQFEQLLNQAIQTNLSEDVLSQIDTFVYDQYGLSEDERKYIDSLPI